MLCTVLIYREFTRSPVYASVVFNFFDKILKSIKVGWASASERYNKTDNIIDMLISDNYHNCINKCEISNTFTNRKSSMIKALRDLYSKHGFTGLKRGFSLFKSRETLSEKQLDCLLNCSLDSLSSLIAKYAGLYINCVKKSNTLYNDLKIYSILDLGRIPGDIETCKEVKENYANLYDNYIYILKFLFKDTGKYNTRDNRSDTEYNKWVSILERKISAVSENNYSKLLDISKQFVGDSNIPSSQIGVRF